MLAILIIILVLLWAAVVWSIYSNFLVFHSNFSESENYHKAYYASISALERWELVTKQRQPWYEWSGWFILWIWTWSFSWSDKSLSWFSYLDKENNSSVFRTINSKTTRIPAKWKWNVERMLAYNSGSSENPDNSNNYNMMDYENAEIFLLYYDESNGNPYNRWTTEQSRPNQITWEIRLPKLLSGEFWFLPTDISSAWAPGSLPTDDAIVDRQIRWDYYSSPFTIYSTSNFTVWWRTPRINKENDSVFRESDINEILKFHFWNDRSPLSRSSDISSPTIISQNESDIIINSLNFKDLFDASSGTQLRFSLLNLLWTWQKVYPFLEYYVDFWWIPVPDKYFTINGEWNYKDYQVNTIIQKPTVKESILWNFTSIF